MTTSTLDNTRTRLASIEGEAAALQAERADKAEQLAPLLALDPSSPAVAQLEAEIAELDSEIAKQNKRIASLQSYIAKAERDASAEAIAARRADAKTAAQRAAQTAVERVAIGKTIDKAVAEFASLLAQWDEAGRAIFEDARAAAAVAHEDSPNERQALQELHNIGAAARGDSAGAFACAVIALEANKMRGHPFVSVAKPLGSMVTFESTAEYAADRIALRCVALADKIAKAGK